MKYKTLKILFVLLICTFKLYAQSHDDKIEIKCKEYVNVDLTHYHGYDGYTGSGDRSYAYSCSSIQRDEAPYSGRTACGSYWDNWSSGGYATHNSPLTLKNMCIAWGLYINGKEITTVGGLLSMIPATELLKLYDPNMVP